MERLTGKVIHQQSDHWMIVAKPAGISIHNDPGKDLLSSLGNGNDSYEGFFAVNRLDRETSGLVLIGLSKKAASLLGELLSSHQIEKKYEALVLGNFGFTPTEGEWNFSLTNKAEGKRNPRGHPKERKPCKTIYKLMEQYKEAALLSLEPKTGRKHQLRRHCAIIGNPIIGDYRYSRKFTDKTSRIGLHASSLAFECPITKEPIHVEYPPTDDFWKLCERFSSE